MSLSALSPRRGYCSVWTLSALPPIDSEDVRYLLQILTTDYLGLFRFETVLVELQRLAIFGHGPDDLFTGSSGKLGFDL